ncbi:DUF4212 domain-containing protein [Guptibacillus algicola]|uniref:DUF4212 domain-containing protein n=1 Tax=Guptibacillus algicola TaxID=225844 RepID=UPI001CD4594E|nr:sodium/substrate symporter small subunit [Alkalihalobacillus algicola]MCA0987120.1 DUF4212 domain-containing protein [Alkalihalobacillus algicola]
MKKIDKKTANAYIKARFRLTTVLLIIWLTVSFGMVLIAETLAQYTFNGFPLHYFMGAQGSIVIFIILLFVNAYICDRIDEKYNLVEKKSKNVKGQTLSQ